MKRERAKLIKDQRRQDLIGKDAFRGVSLSYSWMANQFGHFSLGFVPVMIIYGLCYRKGMSMWWFYIPAFGVWLGWFIFELFNFVITVSKRVGRSYFFLRRKKHFLDDLVTDILFFGLGVAAAMLIVSNTMTAYLVLLSIIIIITIPLWFSSKYWYLSKIFLQRALYPFQFRLSQWNEKLHPSHKLAIKQFMDATYSGTHLLVFGEDDNEKIHICVGIGSEISYDLKKCRYLTAMKAFECFYREEAKDSPSSHKFCWNWEEAELLIIDDINPSHADIPEVITADEFLHKIDLNFSTRNRERLRERKVIWMMGNENPEKTEQEIWKNMLLKIGVDEKNIILLDLSEKK